MTAAVTCPQCGAGVPADAAWCPLCFAQVAGGFDPLTAPIEEVLGHTTTATQTVQAPPVAAPTADAAPEPVEAPAVEPLQWHADIETYVAPTPSPVIEPLTTDAVTAGATTAPVEASGQPATELSDVDVMLAMLAAEHRQADPSSEWMDRFGDKNSRMMIILGGTALVAAVIFVLLTVFGALT